MTNRTAIIILILLGVTFLADTYFETGVTVFTGQKLLWLIDLIAIWR